MKAKHDFSCCPFTSLPYTSLVIRLTNSFYKTLWWSLNSPITLNVRSVYTSINIAQGILSRQQATLCGGMDKRERSQAVRTPCRDPTASSAPCTYPCPGTSNVCGPGPSGLHLPSSHGPKDGLDRARAPCLSRAPGRCPSAASSSLHCCCNRSCGSCCDRRSLPAPAPAPCALGSTLNCAAQSPPCHALCQGSGLHLLLDCFVLYRIIRTRTRMHKTLQCKIVTRRCCPTSSLTSIRKFRALVCREKASDRRFKVRKQGPVEAQ